MIICPTAKWIVSFLCMVDSIVERCIVGNVGRCSCTLCLVMMSVDRCWDGSVDRRRIPYPIGMVEKSIFLSTNTLILCSSFVLVILIILLCMQISSVWRCCSVYRKNGIVVVILPTVNRTFRKIFYYVVWTTVDWFFEVIVDRFLICTVNRCGVWVSIYTEYSVSYSAPQWHAAMSPGSFSILLEDVCGFITGIGS